MSCTSKTTAIRFSFLHTGRVAPAVGGRHGDLPLRFRRRADTGTCPYDSVAGQARGPAPTIPSPGRHGDLPLRFPLPGRHGDLPLRFPLPAGIRTYSLARTVPGWRLLSLYNVDRVRGESHG